MRKICIAILVLASLVATAGLYGCGDDRPDVAIPTNQPAAAGSTGAAGGDGSTKDGRAADGDDDAGSKSGDKNAAPGTTPRPEQLPIARAKPVIKVKIGSDIIAIRNKYGAPVRREVDPNERTAGCWYYGTDQRYTKICFAGERVTSVQTFKNKPLPPKPKS